MAIAYVKEHGSITARILVKELGWVSRKATNRLAAWAKLGWFSYKGEATYEAGPKMVGERLMPKPGSDEALLLEAIRRSGTLDREDAEIAIDDVPDRARQALRRLIDAGWVKVNARDRFEIARDPFISVDVRRKVERLVEELRQGVRKFN